MLQKRREINAVLQQSMCVCVCVKKSFQFQCKKKKKESDECIKSKENPIKSNQTLAAFFFTNSNKVFLYE
jgi:hypothetical protein